MPGHYAGDNCPMILEAMGAITDAGKLREKTFGNFSLGISEDDRLVKRAANRARRMAKNPRKRKTPTHLGVAL